MDEQIEVLNGERLRLVEGVNAGMLDPESVKERILEIEMAIEERERNQGNPFDKMFPGQSLTRDIPEMTSVAETMNLPGPLGRLSNAQIEKMRTASENFNPANQMTEFFVGPQKSSMSDMNMPNPEQLGAYAARFGKNINEVMDEAFKVANEVGAPVKEYIEKVIQGYKQEIGKNKGGEARSFPDLTGDGKVTQADILKGRGVKMANGGEIDMAIEDVSRGTMAMPAQEEMQPTQEEITMVQQVMETVMQMVAQGASEEEIVMALQQMGLDQEDIAMVMQIVAQQMQEAPAPGAAIDAELSQMM